MALSSHQPSLQNAFDHHKPKRENTIEEIVCLQLRPSPDDPSLEESYFYKNFL